MLCCCCVFPFSVPYWVCLQLYCTLVVCHTSSPPILLLFSAAKTKRRGCNSERIQWELIIITIGHYYCHFRAREQITFPHITIIYLFCLLLSADTKKVRSTLDLNFVHWCQGKHQTYNVDRLKYLSASRANQIAKRQVV